MCHVQVLQLTKECDKLSKENAKLQTFIDKQNKEGQAKVDIYYCI